MASFQRCLTSQRYLLSEYKGRFPESTCSGMALKLVLDEAGTADGGSGRWQKSSLLLSQLLLLILVPVPSLFPLLLCWWSLLHGGVESQVGGLIQMGEKNGKNFLLFWFVVWFVFPDGSSLQHNLSCGYKYMD